MMFEYDELKSYANFKKHGIDFMDARLLWDDPNLLEVPARAIDEPRFLTIGLIGDRHWTAVITYREGKVRIISVRRSRNKEIAMYES